jgi:hypothetical protein
LVVSPIFPTLAENWPIFHRTALCLFFLSSSLAMQFLFLVLLHDLLLSLQQRFHEIFTSDSYFYVPTQEVPFTQVMKIVLNSNLTTTDFPHNIRIRLAQFS